MLFPRAIILSRLLVGFLRDQWPVARKIFFNGLILSSFVTWGSNYFLQDDSYGMREHVACLSAAMCLVAAYYHLYRFASVLLIDLECKEMLIPYVILPISMVSVILMRYFALFLLANIVVFTAFAPLAVLFLRGIDTAVSIKLCVGTLLSTVAFFSASAFHVAIVLRSRVHLDNFWVRVVVPLGLLSWMEYARLGFCKWNLLISLINAVNPAAHVVKMWRHALLGEHQNIAWEVSMVVLVALSVLFLISALRQLIKRFDFVC